MRDKTSEITEMCFTQTQQVDVLITHYLISWNDTNRRGV